MKTNKTACAAAAGLMAACLTAATASAQTYLVCEYSNTAGAVSQVSVANLKPNWVVTGVRNSENVVELISWESTGSALIRRGSATGPAAGSGPVATVALSSSQVITAEETANGILQLTSWSVSSTGAVTPGSSTIAQNAQVLSMAKLDPSHVIVAFADLGGGLELSLFAVSSNGTITYETTQVKIVAANMTSIAAISSNQVVTATQNEFGDLLLVSWSVNANELLGPMSITEQEDATAGGVQGVSITAWGDEGHVATAVLNSTSNLEVIDWAVNPNTGAIARKASSTVEQALRVAVSTIGNQVFTAVQDFHATVVAGAWGYNGSTFLQIASQPQEFGGEVSAAPLNSGNYSVTAAVTWSGDLEVDVWHYYTIGIG